MKSTKACALAVAGESWLEVILELLFMAYNRKGAVGILLLRGMAVNGLANIEELILVLQAPTPVPQARGANLSLIYEAQNTSIEMVTSGQPFPNGFTG
jgi:hypothetical protein